mgnify:CR=1 FL=1
MSNATATIAPPSSLFRLAEQYQWFMASADAAPTAQEARRQESAAAGVAVHISVAAGRISVDEAADERSDVLCLLSDLAGIDSPQRDELRAWLNAYDAI